MELQYREPGERIAECADVDIATLRVGQSVHVRRSYADRGPCRYDIVSEPKPAQMARWADSTGMGHYMDYLGTREVAEIRGQDVIIRAESVGD